MSTPSNQLLPWRPDPVGNLNPVHFLRPRLSQALPWPTPLSRPSPPPPPDSPLPSRVSVREDVSFPTNRWEPGAEQRRDSAEQESEARPCTVSSPHGGGPVFCEPNQVPGNQGRCARAAVGAPGNPAPEGGPRVGGGQRGAGRWAPGPGRQHSSWNDIFNFLSEPPNRNICGPAPGPAMSSFLFSLDR